MITQEQFDRAMANYACSHGYRDDIEKIQTVAATMGLRISAGEAQAIWREHSDLYAAGWLGIGDCDEPAIASAISRFVDANEPY